MKFSTAAALCLTASLGLVDAFPLHLRRSHTGISHADVHMAARMMQVYPYPKALKFRPKRDMNSDYQQKLVDLQKQLAASATNPQAVAQIQQQMMEVMKAQATAMATAVPTGAVPQQTQQGFAAATGAPSLPSQTNAAPPIAAQTQAPTPSGTATTPAGGSTGAFTSTSIAGASNAAPNGSNSAGSSAPQNGAPPTGSDAPPKAPASGPEVRGGTPLAGGNTPSNNAPTSSTTCTATASPRSMPGGVAKSVKPAFGANGDSIVPSKRWAKYPRN